MRKLAATLGALALGAGLAAVPAGSAAADPLVIGPRTTLLQIVISAPEGAGPSTRTEPIVVQLGCDLVGNTHPYPAEACAELEAADGDISAIPSEGGCAGVWQPVDVTVDGIFRGMPLQWEAKQVSNEGCAFIMHGHVLRVLGPPVVEPPVDPPAPTA